MAIAKEVYDRLNLLEDDNIILTNKHNDNKVINEKEHLHNNEGENHIPKKKLKFFLIRFFKGRNCFVRFLRQICKS
ncbi:hypothetical protein [Clostridium beijerinckii]|uniref:hypothetical protein n=1 Tax=Clostridium beijerinckii TaxID=1520 RepID=UPI001F4BF5D1|nr:hypothetical protein [Clostridium beijerinckii]NRU14104.1 hypothetical protein [Clostridium beijerinckii]